MSKKTWIIIVGIIAFIVISGIIANLPDDKPATAQNVATPAPTATPQASYTFDVPSLLGKNIDEIRQVLGSPADGKLTEPTAEQLKGTSEWNNTFKKDGQELLVTFDAKTRKIMDFFISANDQNKDRVLNVGNLKSNDPRYTVEFVKEVKDPSKFTGVKVMPK